MRRLCEERAVVFTDVDLRWGITEEQAAEGKVLPLCLAEIDASRPYFIAILGERYGWVSEHIAAELVELHPWLAEHRTRSVTELEIVHGVLNDPAMAGRAFFYFRDREASRALGEAGAPEDETAAASLVDLKARIRASGLPLREGFRTPEELEQQVLADLKAALEEEFPEDAVPDPLTRERLAHEAFSDELAERFVPRPVLEEALAAHATSEGPPLLLTGVSGSGKSALLAHVVRSSAVVNPDMPIVVHFCGASAVAADWKALCRRVAAELELTTGVAAELPDDPSQLKAAFKNYLSRAAAHRPYLVLLDGLDQLEDTDAALELAFLPPKPPPGCRLVVSAASGTRPTIEAERREWQLLEVGDLTPEERPAVLVALLARRAKALDPRRSERICAAPAAASPLFLSVLVDELSVVGAHDSLDDLLDSYLAVAVPDDLYERVLVRYEVDYERERPGLIGDVMRALWAARRGISEDELLDLAGSDERPLTQAQLAPLLLALGRQLSSRSGLLTFGHALLRKAVEDRYLPGDQVCRVSHRDLAALFASDPLAPRALEELPWQLVEAEEWERLAALLGRLDVLAALLARDEYDVRRYSAAIESNSVLRMARTWTPLLEGEEVPTALLLVVGDLLRDLGHLDLAFRSYERCGDVARAADDRAVLAGSFNNRALILMGRGELDAAMSLLRAAERICRELRDPAGLQISLGNQAEILMRRGDLDGAMHALKEVERVFREQAEPSLVESLLGKQANILYLRGDFDGAMALYREQERLCRELGNPAGLSASLGSQALIFAGRGDLAGALALHAKEERICRDLGDRTGLAGSLGNQALILMDRGDHDGALTLQRQQESICRELSDARGVATSLNNQAAILMDRGDIDGALALLERAERISRELRDPYGLHTSMGNRASILYRRGDLDGALTLQRQTEVICRELDDPLGLSASLGNQAGILFARGHLDEAAALLKEAETIFRELGDVAGLRTLLDNQALILTRRGDLEGLIALHDEMDRLRPESDGPTDLQASLGSQAVIVAGHGDLEGAMALRKEEERICRELGDRAGLQRSLGGQTLILIDRADLDGAATLLGEQELLCNELAGQALILVKRGDVDGGVALLSEQERFWREFGDRAGILAARGELDGAMMLLEYQERLCRKFGMPGLQTSLGNQAIVLYLRGDLDRAMVLHQEQERLCRELGDPAGLQRSLGNQALVLEALGDLAGAMAFLQDKVRMCRELSDPAGLAVALRNQAACLLSLDRPRDALPVIEESVELTRSLGSSALESRLAVLVEARRRIAEEDAG